MFFCIYLYYCQRVLDFGLRSNINSCRSKPGTSEWYFPLPLNCQQFGARKYIASIIFNSVLCLYPVVVFHHAEATWLRLLNAFGQQIRIHFSTFQLGHHGLLAEDCYDQATHLVVETWHTWEILKGLRDSTWHRTFLHTNTRSCKYDLIVLSYCDCVFCHLRLFARDCGLHLSIF